MLSNNYLILVISGPSGCGKTTVCNELLQREKNMAFSISCTTRKKRINEENAKDYFFISKKKFENLIEKNQFLEYAKVFDNYYGTLKNQVLRTNKTKHILLDIDVQGALQVKKYCQESIYFKEKTLFIFIMPPSMEELYRRLAKRKTDSEEEVKKRMNMAKKEITFSKHYDYSIINNYTTETVDEIFQLMKNH